MKYKLLLIGVLYAGFALADIITISVGEDASGDDLFEGAAILGTTNIGGDFDARDAFGGTYSSIEPGKVLGEDGQTMRIEFNPGSVTVNQIIISLSSDAPDNDRGVQQVRFYADTGSGWESVFVANPSNPYSSTYGDYGIKVQASLDTAITSDKWAVEFDPTSGYTYTGVRVTEIDGYNVVPEPASMLMLALGGGIITLIRRVYSRG
jgi:hypothetical protein